MKRIALLAAALVALVGASQGSAAPKPKPLPPDQAAAAAAAVVQAAPVSESAALE